MEKPASIETATRVISAFIGIAEDLAELPKLASPQYQQAAKSLCEICGKLQSANQKVTGWMFRFRYLDFQQEENQVRTTFFATSQEYMTLKSSQMHQLTITCHDIGRIYRDNLQPILGELLEPEPQKKTEHVFEELSNLDNEWLSFVHVELFLRLDAFVNTVEKQILDRDMDGAADSHRKFIEKSTEVSTQLNSFTGALTSLVDRFADIAGTPATLCERRDE